MCINRDLTLHEVLHYFHDNHSYPASKTSAIRTNGGELILFSLPQIVTKVYTIVSADVVKFRVIAVVHL